MDQSTVQKKKFSLWLKITLKLLATAAIAAVLLFVLPLTLLLAVFTGNQYQVCGAWVICSAAQLIFLLLWFPKKKPFMLSVLGAFVAHALVFGLLFAAHTYNESLIIDTAPAIDVNEYLPFDEHSETVKHRSQTLTFREDPPIIDGAAALFPVYAGFVHATYPEDTVLGKDVFQYNNTPDGYKALAEKMTDLFIGVYPSEEQIAYAEKNGTHFTYTPIGYDAFVFFVHKNNPIDSLTAEQIRAIYAGEITNWKEVGGLDEEIVAYQRNAGSGSQSMLLRFMGDKEPMAAPSEEVIGGMGGIIEEVADYRSETTSIGFSFRFYVEGIIKNPSIKMIAIDGVLPTAENVRNESYPIRTPFYAVTYEENDNPNTRVLIDWILSAEGQRIIEETGYVGIGAES